MDTPTKAERFSFETNGYLKVDRFLPLELTERLLRTTERVVERRAAMAQAGEPHTGETDVARHASRIFYILDDDPPLMPYVRAFLNKKPHHHASDAIIESGPKGREFGWHRDGHDGGYDASDAPIPMLQLKVGYYLTDMGQSGQGNLSIVPGSHKTPGGPSDCIVSKIPVSCGSMAFMRVHIS